MANHEVADSESRACVLTVLLNKLAKDNWELEGPLEYDIGLGMTHIAILLHMHIAIQSHLKEQLR